MNRMIRTWVEISLDAIEHNYRAITASLPAGCQMLGVCKANAYGHGAARVAQRLQEAGCRWVAVNCYDEVEELRAAGVQTEILMLSPQPANIALDIVDLDATQAVESLSYAENLNRYLVGTDLRLKVHMKLETGMGRTGFDATNPACRADMLRALALEHLDFTGVFTHFAVSDEPEQEEFTREQYRVFTETVAFLERETGRRFPLRHCANSGAVVNYPEMAMDMVRPGLLLYGLYPGAERGGLELVPAMQLKSRVCAVTHHRRGDTISYGRTFTCDRDMTLAVIPAGYADGLLRALSGHMDVMVRDRRVHQVGRICMDMCMLDVTDVPGVRVGDVVTVFGRDITASEQADRAGTIPYELLCAMSQRVPRVYL